jgi:GH15 family glucan-1,4-alpha-glucosidase
VGLLPEQIDPTSGEFYGNFPQAFSHIGVIAGGVRLVKTFAEARAADTGRVST